MRPRYVVRITPADVGGRVSVRSRLPGATSGPRLTDTVGTLRRWAAGVLEIERRDGSVARVAEADLVAGRVIGPDPSGPRR